MHVRTHERTVGVIVFEERNQASGHGDELLGRHVHVLHLGGLDFDEIAAVADRNHLAGELAVRVDRGIRLGDVEVFVAVTAEVDDLVERTAIVDLAIRGLDETEFVDAGKGAQ